MKGVRTVPDWYDERPRAIEHEKARFAGNSAVRALLAQLVEHFHGKSYCRHGTHRALKRSLA
jgi:hypothetical protein